MNLVLWSKGSSGAIPFSTLIALLALWFGVSVPLTFVGAYFGFRKRVRILDFPTKNFQLIRYVFVFRPLNTQFEQIKSHDKFPINLFTPNPFPAL
jgi:hypothetical protein